MRSWSKLLAGVSAAAAVVGLLGVHTTNAPAAVAQACDKSGYKLSLLSLTGPPRADLVIRVSAKAAGCEVPTTLVRIQVAVLAFKKLRARKLVVSNVPAPGGTATINLGRVQRQRLVHATVSFGPRVVLAAQTRTRLKPDLVLTRAYAGRSAVIGRPFFVVAIVRNPTKDVGLGALVTVSAAGAPLATKQLKVGPRRRVVVQIPVTLTQLGPAQLTVTVTPSSPIETTLANNVRGLAVETAEFKVQESATLAQSFAGYGGQFNHHVYAAISRAVGVTDDNAKDMERKMRELRPQFSRVFFNNTAFTDPDRMQSFVRTVQLAQSTGTTIDITWQGGTLSVANGTIPKFAAVLIDLVRARGITNLRWLTLQNEPNRTKITMAQYEAQYRALDPYIQSIRGQVRYMGGDLVRGPDVGAPNQQAWLQYMATKMADILDAYSIHVFWDYFDTQKLVDRLTEVRAIVNALPQAGRKPLYVSEYGVRGLRTFNGAPAGDPGVWEDGTPMTKTNVNAFQQAWFDVLAARLGYVGTSKWDSYFGKYDNGTQAYYMIGSPAEGWPLYPIYNSVRLLTSTVGRGWRTVNVDSIANDSRLLAAYVWKAGEHTVIGLDTAGAQLNTVSPTVVTYTIGGLPPSKSFEVTIWNAAGDGLVGQPVPAATDPAGVVTISVPQQAVFALRG
ncbi:MAG: hypothetical protein AUG74_03945 [Bacteroidetes bacterium 13_1_20CM_4_60_6]|nr:MAG: hypothetical protein AUG74_03945 [Bacteroidetes bacterium 13_1_20CM_4_60_6]